MTTPQMAEERFKDERNGAERCWIWRDGYHYPQVSFTKPNPAIHKSVEYMRVLSRQEVEKLHSNEGVDTMQLINSLNRTIDGQRRHLTRLEAQLATLRAQLREYEPPAGSREWMERQLPP